LRRTLLAGCLWVTVLLSFTGTASALPPQGVYDGCAPGGDPVAGQGVSACVSRLQQLRAHGFTIVLNYSSLYGSSDEIRQYAAAAESLGIRLIWPLHHPSLRTGAGAQAYLQLGRECGCTSTPDLIRYIVSMVKDLPATYMYYVGDEVPDTQHAAVRQISDLIHTLDPAHPRFYVTFGSNVTGQSLSGFTDTADMLGGDSYPIEVGGDPSVVSADTRTTARIATAAARPYAMVLQAFCFCQEGHPGARYPTRAEYRQMLGAALTAGRPSFVLWWSYYRLLESDDPAARVGDLFSAVFGTPWPPDTRLTRATSRSVAFEASEPSDTTECRIDSAPWSPCTSPVRLDGLAPGPHALRARARDSFGTVDPTPAVWHVRIRNLLSFRVVARAGGTPRLRIDVRRATRARLVARHGRRRLTVTVALVTGATSHGLPAAIARRMTPGRWSLTIAAGREALSRTARIP
jgi:hypothetical protein